MAMVLLVARACCMLGAFICARPEGPTGCVPAQVWSLLFQRLQAAKTARFVRGFLLLLAHVVASRGPAALAASTDAVQPGIFLIILQQVRPVDILCPFGRSSPSLLLTPGFLSTAQAFEPCRGSPAAHALRGLLEGMCRHARAGVGAQHGVGEG